MILGIIVACEVAFWVVIALGLTLRYPLRRPRLGFALMATVPLIDVVLLVAVAAHLHGGGSATTAHSLAAFYLGFSLAYGHRMIAWADAHYAHRFADGPRPERLSGAAHTQRCWGDVVRTAAACALAAAISWGLVAWFGAGPRTAALESTYRWAALITGVEFLAAVSYTLWPRRPAQSSVGSARAI
ncbi:hypothetical protein ACQP1U_16320 [Actinomycetota bacterium]